MIRLRVLGSVDLRDGDGREIRSVLLQPKRLSLLLYLALARPRGFHRRDTLVGLFWPEVAPDRARASLNQAVHVLRRSLGAEVIVSRGSDELAVSSEQLGCDAWEFDAALTGADPGRALELYHGELLPGFSAAESPEFERWLEAERSEFASRALQGVQSLVERAENAGDLDTAVTWARRALALAPYDEPAVVRLMQLLARKGDRAAAIRTCEEFSERLWNDIELRLSASTREVLSRIKRDAGLPDGNGHARAAAEAVEPVATDEHALAPAADLSATAADPAESTASAAVPLPTERSAAPATPAGAWPRLRRRRWAWIGAAALILVAAGGAIALRWFRARRPPSAAVAAAPTRVAVLYFDVTDSTADLRPLADGLTESLIEQLNQPNLTDALQVISRNGVRPFRGITVPPDSIRRALNVGLIISGSLSRWGDSVRASVQLSDAVTQTALYTTQIDRRWSDRFGLVDALSAAVGQFLRNQLGREIRLKQAQLGTRNMAAWELLRRSRTMRLEASKADADGQASVATGLYENADSLLARASRADPDWVDPLIDRAYVANNAAWRALFAGKGPPGVRQAVDAGLTLANKALAVAPGTPGALEIRGMLEYTLWTLAKPAGKAADELEQAAEKDLRAALAADPQRAQSLAILSAIDIDRWRLAESKDEAERAYQADSYLLQGEDVVHRLFMTSFELHQDADARHYCSEWGRRFGQQWEWAYCRLLLLVWADPVPSPDTAWKVFDEPSRVDGPAMRARTRPLLGMLVGAALARAGLADSARHVLAATHAAGGADPEVVRIEAAARLLLGDTAEARRLLADYYARTPLSVQQERMRPRSRIFAPLPSSLGARAAR